MSNRAAGPMYVSDMRLKALELATRQGGTDETAVQIVERARRYFDFLSGPEQFSESKAQTKRLVHEGWGPVTYHNVFCTWYIPEIFDTAEEARKAYPNSNIYKINWSDRKGGA